LLNGERRRVHARRLVATTRARGSASREGGGRYLCGPLAGSTLNHDQLSALAKDAARGGGLGRNLPRPLPSIIVRSVELVYACDEA